MSADESAAFKKMLQQRVRRDTAYLVENDFFDLLLDAVVIVLYGTLHHALPGRFVDEGVYDRNLRIPRGLRLDLVVVWSMRSSKLSLTAPTNIPCVSVEILLGGIRLSIWVLKEWLTSCRFIDTD